MTKLTQREREIQIRKQLIAETRKYIRSLRIKRKAKAKQH